MESQVAIVKRLNKSKCKKVAVVTREVALVEVRL